MEAYKIKVLVVDDEQEVRQTLVDRLDESGNWEILGQTDSVPNTINFIKSNKLDAIFLDIKIKQGSAFDVLDYFKNKNFELPSIVINTGFNEFQLAQKIFNDYKNEVISILQKPFWENWALKEMEIVEIIHSILDKQSISFTDNILQIRIDSTSHFLNADEIIFIEIEEKQSNKCKIALKDKTLVANKPLNKLTELLPQNFIQINRQSYINKNYRSSYNHETHELELKHIVNRTFYVSKSYRGSL